MPPPTIPISAIPSLLSADRFQVDSKDSPRAFLEQWCRSQLGYHKVPYGLDMEVCRSGLTLGLPGLHRQRFTMKKSVGGGPYRSEFIQTLIAY